MNRLLQKLFKDDRFGLDCKETSKFEFKIGQGQNSTTKTNFGSDFTLSYNLEWPLEVLLDVDVIAEYFYC